MDAVQSGDELEQRDCAVARKGLFHFEQRAIDDGIDGCSCEADLRAVTAKGFYKQTADIEMTDSPAFYGLHLEPKFQGEYDGDGYGIGA